LEWPWIIAVFVGAVLGLLHRFEQTEGVGMAAMWANPALMGILAGITWPKAAAAKSLGVSLTALVVATPLLGESLICLIYVLPWHLVIAPSVGAITAAIVRRTRRSAGTTALLLLIGFGQVAVAPRIDAATQDRSARVTFADRVIVDAPREVVWASIERLHLDFDHPSPWVVSALLPRPVAIRGGGADVGSERRVVFDNGVILARVTESDPPRRFAIDLSIEKSGPEFFDHWSELETSYFKLESLPGGRTAISHVTTYRPLAFPRWYFEPGERALGSLVQRYLLEAYANELDGAEGLLQAGLR